ncbi:MAG: NUDIX domain-containing protein [Bacteroidales bacterium]
MYKVFFDNRTICFVDDFDKFYKKNNGLFVKYINEIQLAYILELFKSVDEINNVFIVHHNVDEIFRVFKSYCRMLEAAGGLVHNSDDEILIIKRRGLWDLPKGKLEENEDPTIGALREVKEECNVHQLQIRDLIHVTYHAYIQDGILLLKKTYWYDMIHYGDGKVKPQTDEDITEVKWFRKDDLDKVVDNTYLSIVEVLQEANLL